MGLLRKSKYLEETNERVILVRFVLQTNLSADCPSTVIKDVLLLPVRECVCGGVLSQREIYALLGRKGRAESSSYCLISSAQNDPYAKVAY